MEKEQIKTLVSNLHGQLSGPDCSPQQQQLLEKVTLHMHDWDDPEPIDPDMKQVLETLVADVEVSHPKAATVIHEILDALANMGI